MESPMDKFIREVQELLDQTEFKKGVKLTAPIPFDTHERVRVLEKMVTAFREKNDAILRRQGYTEEKMESLLASFETKLSGRGLQQYRELVRLEKALQERAMICSLARNVTRIKTEEMDLQSISKKAKEDKKLTGVGESAQQKKLRRMRKREQWKPL